MAHGLLHHSDEIPDLHHVGVDALPLLLIQFGRLVKSGYPLPGGRKRHTHLMTRPQDGVGDQHLRLCVDVLELQPGGFNGPVRVQRISAPQSVDVLHHQNPIPADAGVQGDVGLPPPFHVLLSLFEAPLRLLATLLQFELLEPGSRTHPRRGDRSQQRAGHTDRRH
ncbi:hypothetical protein [Streptomyces sp. A0642]|uniref:hypothetical protein n=1 Tax=Streptomyces sp. A0642 TaxID=2563100 RepID=UPI0014482184|nr:hypothetical protein [Streptomyces sp. A0642]